MGKQFKLIAKVGGAHNPRCISTYVVLVKISCFLSTLLKLKVLRLWIKNTFHAEPIHCSEYRRDA